jgi:NADPH:quinone reductase-like Zn-dependent oxidoreductase
MADSRRNVIYLHASGPVLKEISEPYRPTENQSLLRVDYSGINPADIKHAAIGLHSSVAGYDMSGEVLQPGPDSPFKPGDMIFGVNSASPGRPLYMGAHQDYAIAAGRFWYTLPPTARLGLREAATLPVMTLTAADGLFHLLGLGFPEAGIAGDTSQGLLIWGGASTVGVAALQLARAAGHVPILVTASTSNHGRLKALGADYCFDYKDDDVVEQIKAAIRNCGKRVYRALDAVGVGSFVLGDDFKKSSPGLTGLSISQDEDGAELACVLPVRGDTRFKLCFATRDPNSLLPMARMKDPQRWFRMQEKVMAWVIEHYGEGKYVGCPNVRVVNGAGECLEAMRRSAEGKSSLEKIVVEHPL